MITTRFEPRKHPHRAANAESGIRLSDARCEDVPLLEIRRLRKCFAEDAGVVAADLVVQRGEIHAIVGVNGSGKSTLAHLIAGIYAPDAGELRVAGRPVRFNSPRDA